MTSPESYARDDQRYHLTLPDGDGNTDEHFGQRDGCPTCTAGGVWNPCSGCRGETRWHGEYCAIEPGGWTPPGGTDVD